MYQSILVIHVLLGLGIVGFVLIQQGKGADAGAAFGSASAGSVFGAQGSSSFLSKTTAILASLFFATSLGLAILSSYKETPVDLMDLPEVESPSDLIGIGDNPADNTLPETPINEEIPSVEATPTGKETPFEAKPALEATPIIEEIPVIEEAADSQIPSDTATETEIPTVPAQ